MRRRSELGSTGAQEANREMPHSEMPYRLLFWGVWLGFFLPTGASAEEQPREVTGIQGESATFPLQSPTSFDAVLWLRAEKHVASLKRGSTCELRIFTAFMKGKVSVSPDCSSLTLRDPHEEDAGEYRAQFQNQTLLQIVATQTFILKVYRRLSGADLEVTCAKERAKDGNETLHLNCSVGKWGDGVKFSWTSTGRSGKVSSEAFLVLPPSSQDDDQNVTCVAENRVGNASRTVSLKQACAAAGQQPTTRPPTVADTETGAPLASAQTITIAIVGGLVVVAASAAALWKCRRKKAAGSQLIPSSSSSGPKDCKSFYAEIPKVPEAQDVESERPQRRRGPGAPKDLPVTIYADVQQIPLQTDDEKIRREKRKAAEKSEKTIYSEISDLKEADKGNLKTIYETVHLPRPPEASEYNKIL